MRARVTVSKAKLIPYAIALGVIAFVSFLQSLRHWSTSGRVIEELEWKTYDLRARSALNRRPPCATNLGFVLISDNDIKNIADGSGGELDYRYGLYWPRAVYGHLVSELKAQGAKLTAFDVLFGELRFDHPQVVVATNQAPLSSDEFFAARIREAGNVAIATSDGLAPNPLFLGNSLALGDISSERDSDGVLRHARAFRTVRFWHTVIERYAARYDFNPKLVLTGPTEILVPGTTQTLVIQIPIDTAQMFDINAFKSQFPGERRVPFSMQGKAYRDQRVWHMGILMAAAELGLDLQQAEYDPKHSRIFLPGTNGVSRTLPVDSEGRFHVDWSLQYQDPRIAKKEITNLLLQEKMRREGRGEGIEPAFRNKVVIVGSIATGNDLTDRGATPIENDAFLVSKHWNVANSIIMNRFITRSPLWLELLAVVVMGVLAAVLTWKLHAPWGTLAVLGGIAPCYIFLAHQVYVEHRYWIPIVLPVVGALLANHGALLTYNIVFEQREKRRVTGVFAKLVSPNVVHQLLGREEIRLEGKREKITVFFADVRGFTKLTDTNQARAEKYVRDHNLTGAAAEAHFDENAKDTLDTVNLYLSAIADQIKKHNGTLDKYIGDCVMAFWGAPTPNERHAVACVRAAIDAQIAMHLINLGRAAKNELRKAENVQRAAAGQEPLNELPLLDLGTGINTGTAIVGMMGSEAHILNYTIFGREVNLASRLEGVSGHSRIIIGEATFRDLEKYEPELAALSVELEPVTPKGFSTPIRIWEVPWKKFLPPGTGELPAAHVAATKPDKPPVSGKPANTA
ncbi:MAG: Adenylate/guanylate cyclase [Limisphaerales bacterium]|nr:MAG: Adenylate/guanylate cyclase [Limisphaerales bacterium]KAG0509427.1 MAG: Adenylate/guanylate cyclase [Limisphaerales bacterium]TXT52264.1 MAG: Adenylate/guanylate cyclase [Limisphaerales bacterium]